MRITDSLFKWDIISDSLGSLGKIDLVPLVLGFFKSSAMAGSTVRRPRDSQAWRAEGPGIYPKGHSHLDLGYRPQSQGDSSCQASWQVSGGRTP